MIRLNPGKLGALNLLETVKKYLCGARVPVYYNDERVGRTEKEAMKIIHELAGENIYELNSELKKEFDDKFPSIRGRYPKLILNVIPLDTGEDHILPDVSGVLITYKVDFGGEIRWKEKDQEYTISATVQHFESVVSIEVFSKNVQNNMFEGRTNVRYQYNWYDLRNEYGFAKTEALGEVFNTFSFCPQISQLGEVWDSFSGQVDLSAAWIAYLDFCNEKNLSINIEEYGCPSINSIFDNTKLLDTTYVYQGVIVSTKSEYNWFNIEYKAAFLLNNEWKPTVKVSRSDILGMPLSLLVAICGLLNKYGISTLYMSGEYRYANRGNRALREWREVRNSTVGQWMAQNRNECIEKALQTLKERQKSVSTDFVISSYEGERVLDKYVMAYVQDNYSMTINYEKGQRIEFYERKKSKCENIYDNFPPMMFCKAASDESRKYICHINYAQRRGITEDHPFIEWLLNNAVPLNLYFQRQFQQMVDGLCYKDAEQIIQEYGMIREQLCSLSNHYGLDVKSMPQISINDFWSEEDEEAPF